MGVRNMTRVPFTYTWIEQDKILAGSIPTSQADVDALRGMGIQSIVTLTRRNIADEFNLGIINQQQFAIPDGGLDEQAVLKAASFLNYVYQDYPSAYVHCRGGIGRT